MLCLEMRATIMVYLEVYNSTFWRFRFFSVGAPQPKNYPIHVVGTTFLVVYNILRDVPTAGHGSVHPVALSNKLHLKVNVRLR